MERTMETGTFRKVTKHLLAATVLLAGVHPLRAPASSQPFDLVIINGHIIDGIGSPWDSGEVGIRAGKIAAIGNLSDTPLTRTVHAQGTSVAPGLLAFVGQSEL